MTKRRIGDILIDCGHVTAAQLAAAIEIQRLSPPPAPLIGDILKQQGLVTDHELDESFIISLNDIIEDPDADRFVKHLASMTAEYVRHNKCGLSEEGALAIICRIDDYKARLARLRESMATLIQMKQLPVVLEQQAENRRQEIMVREKMELLCRDLRNMGLDLPRNGNQES